MKEINLKKYTTLVKASTIKEIVFKSNTYITVLGNLLYLVIAFFLWREIFNSSPSDIVNGMTFYDTLIYLVLASAMTTFMECQVTWGLGLRYKSGHIALEMIKPIDFQAYWFFSLSGKYIVAFLTTFFPTFLIVFIITNGYISLGVNLIFFLVSMCLSVLLNFFIDFFVGIICFFTQSIWGINIMKEALVTLLSGAIIPIAFFPEILKKIVNFLPFHAIYNSPLQLLIGSTLTIKESLHILIIQLFWVIIVFLISRIAWNMAKKNIIINGG